MITGISSVPEHSSLVEVRCSGAINVEGRTAKNRMLKRSKRKSGIQTNEHHPARLTVIPSGQTAEGESGRLKRLLSESETGCKNEVTITPAERRGLYNTSGARR